MSWRRRACARSSTSLASRIGGRPRSAGGKRPEPSNVASALVGAARPRAKSGSAKSFAERSHCSRSGLPYTRGYQTPSRALASGLAVTHRLPLAIPGAARLARPVTAAAGALRWIAMQVLTAPASFGHSDCERIVGAALAQLVLAVTSLAYVAAGAAVLSWAVRVRAPLAGAAGVAVGGGRGRELRLPRAPAVMGGARPQLAHRRRGSGVRRRPGPERAAAVGLGDSGRRLRAGTGRYAAGRSGSPLCRPDACGSTTAPLAG